MGLRGWDIVHIRCIQQSLRSTSQNRRRIIDMQQGTTLNEEHLNHNITITMQTQSSQLRQKSQEQVERAKITSSFIPKHKESQIDMSHLIISPIHLERQESSSQIKSTKVKSSARMNPWSATDSTYKCRQFMNNLVTPASMTCSALPLTTATNNLCTITLMHLTISIRTLWKASGQSLQETRRKEPAIL